MKPFLTLAALVLALTTIHAQETLSTFDRVSVTGNVVVTLIQGDKPSYTTEGDTEHLKVSVDEGKLKISKINIRDGWSNETHVTVYYTSIRGINASAGSKVEHEGTLNGPSLELNADTGSNMRLEVDVNSLTASVGEGGVMLLEGATKAFEAKATAGAVLKARDLIAHQVFVDVNTGATATVHASDEIEASATLGGSITYEGSPKEVRVNESLGGSVKG